MKTGLTKESFYQEFYKAQRVKIFGFELMEIETQEYEFDYINYSQETNIMQWLSYKIVVDYDFTLDENLNCLMDKILESGIYE